MAPVFLTVAMHELWPKCMIYATPIAEQYDVDICGGRAANGEYHHHFYTSCLADMLNHDGSVHSKCPVTWCMQGSMLFQ
ncbi:hypothetical protein ADS77_05130 [Pseudoalteromonas porphyrae]|uniref:Uncharacterized protein n=1 Tax=Pseudoalteromonas porphyrae TaxID=187330 RepID=A0A0N1ENZ6_9GAMM|nr:hypothetical protein [Pseudoalteromonas porphyrae]KPH64655.1 hypothetical protein ADS77_05130 [Pseudoalteromonas porphyrae]